MADEPLKPLSLSPSLEENAVFVIKFSGALRGSVSCSGPDQAATAQDEEDGQGAAEAATLAQSPLGSDGEGSQARQAATAESRGPEAELTLGIVTLSDFPPLSSSCVSRPQLSSAVPVWLPRGP